MFFHPQLIQTDYITVVHNSSISFIFLKHLHELQTKNYQIQIYIKLDVNYNHCYEVHSKQQ